MSDDYNMLDRVSQRQRLFELATVFLKLGTIAFGGPAAHVAMMEEEVVTRRSWMTREKLLELFGMTNLIPGPNSTELAMQIGYDRAGWWGLVIAGVCFIGPAMAIVWGLAIGYAQTQTLPQLSGVLYGIKPVIVVIILQALWKLGQKAVTDWVTGLAGVVAIGAYFFGWDEVAVLIGLGGLVWLVRRQKNELLAWVPISGLLVQIPEANPIGTIKSIDWTNVFVIFFKIGTVLYGSGYVLLAFLQRELVDRNGWLTSQQLIDAVAIGQLTPGPVLTTATFIGYLLAGNSGAIAGTIGIFLPSFLLVGILNLWVMPWMRSAGFKAFLAGVTAGSLGLMAGVTLTLIRSSLVDVWTIGISILAAIVLLKFKINSAVLILVGGAFGWILQFNSFIF
ncbi:MAG: chromate efflux transporter [Alkalinema sp. CAN_BIN05]|nr:chromate efflux transporter [Alkalinema sp. CAN_BIN05]